MLNIVFVEHYYSYSLGWTTPRVPETLFINIAWKMWKWDKIRNTFQFIISMINFESVQNTFRRISKPDLAFKLDDLIEHYPYMLNLFDRMTLKQEKELLKDE